jgi:hypothetical protein
VQPFWLLHGRIELLGVICVVLSLTIQLYIYHDCVDTGEIFSAQLSVAGDTERQVGDKDLCSPDARGGGTLF